MAPQCRGHKPIYSIGPQSVSWPTSSPPDLEAELTAGSGVKVDDADLTAAVPIVPQPLQLTPTVGTVLLPHPRTGWHPRRLAIRGRGIPFVYFTHACQLGCEGIVSKRIDSPYRSGPSKTWLKIKNPAAPGLLRFEDRDALA
jgi:hypothetical protein